MSVTKKTVVTLKDINGVEVKIQQDTLKNVLQATTTEGKDVFLDPESETSMQTSVTIMFDDIVSDGIPKMLHFEDAETPSEAWRVVNVGLFDGTQMVFSHPKKAAEFLMRVPDGKLLSPAEKAANVVSIEDYKK